MRQAKVMSMARHCPALREREEESRVRKSDDEKGEEKDKYRWKTDLPKRNIFLRPRVSTRKKEVKAAMA